MHDLFRWSQSREVEGSNLVGLQYVCFAGFRATRPQGYYSHVHYDTRFEADRMF